MVSTKNTSSAPVHPRAVFATTHWPVVLTAGTHHDTTRSRDAVSRLCPAYWYPLYTYVRRRGYWFETRTGRKGILQITGFTENPRGVKLRYKLVQADEAAMANSPALAPAPAAETSAGQAIARLKFKQAELEVKAAE